MATLKRLFSLAVLIATLAAIASPVAGWSNVNGDEAVRLLEAQSNTSGVFAACDGDADGAISLAEQQAALRRFYDAFSRTKDAAR
ncbi:MAG: hypothetical protein IT463_05605, partial [Planctomycetes bacterium]|nr:hypothetical protein [Planctomycetota bacterium]